MTQSLADQIDAAFKAEQTVPLIARTREDIPRTYEAISDEWLTVVLCRNVSGAAVIGHRLGPPDNGSNYPPPATDDQAETVPSIVWKGLHPDRRAVSTVDRMAASASAAHLAR